MARARQSAPAPTSFVLEPIGPYMDHDKLEAGQMGRYGACARFCLQDGPKSGASVEEHSPWCASSSFGISGVLNDRTAASLYVDAVMRYAGYQPSAITPPGQHAILLQEPNGAKVFVTVNGGANTILQDDKARVWNSYQAQDPQVKAIFLLRAGKPNTSYHITDLLTQKQWQATSDKQGYVRVSNDGWNMRGLRVE